MTVQRTLWSRTGIAAFVILLLAFDNTPSVPSVPEVIEAPDPAEIELLEDFQTWLFGETGQYRAFEPKDLAAVIRNRPRSFELFRSYPSREASQAFMQRLPFGDQIERVSERYRVDSLLVAALVEVESGFDPHAISSKGAVGLMQITSVTAETFGSPDTRDPAINLDVGTRYLSRLLRTYDGDLELALAAYNAGPGNVRRYGGVPPFRETQRYVDKVLSGYLENCREVWEAEGSDRLLDLG